MNVTINIYGDVHIHCDCCDGCGVYDDNFRRTPSKPRMRLHPIRRTAAKRPSRPLRKRKLWSRHWRRFFFRFLPEETGEGGGAHEGI